MINFSQGSPSSDLYPHDLLSKATQHCLDKLKNSVSFSQETLDYVPQLGNVSFRKNFACFLNKMLPSSKIIHHDQLLVTPGASLAISLIVTLYLKAGDTILVEDPTYFIAKDIFRDYHLNIVTVPSDKDGICLEQIPEETLGKIKMLYIIPVFQNPSGSSISHKKRLDLLDLAKKWNFLIIADEVYQTMYYSTEPLPSLVDYDEGSHVFSVGSFSKILFPGIRLGWIQVGKKSTLLDKMDKSGTLWSGGGLNSLTSSIIDSAIELGLLEKHLLSLRETYSKRLDILSDSLDPIRGKYIEFEKPSGGYFLWIKVLGDIEMEKLTQIPGVKLKLGKEFGDSSHSYIRLCFGHVTEDEIKTGGLLICDFLSKQHEW